MAPDDRDERHRSDAPGDSTPPAEGQSAVRGAFLARQAQSAAPGGGGDSAPGAVTLRGAYLSRLTRETQRGSPVAGTEETGGRVLRGIYAARSLTVTVQEPAPRPARTGARKAAKAAPPKKARAVKKAGAAKKAASAKTPKKAAGRRKVRAVAATRPAKRKKAAPVRQARKAARKTQRRR